MLCTGFESLSFHTRDLALEDATIDAFECSVDGRMYVIACLYPQVRVGVSIPLVSQAVECVADVPLILRRPTLEVLCL